MPSTARLASRTLVGRDDESQAVLAALDRMADGEPGVVTVTGQAGIGKTRFVTALAGRLHEDGVRVLSGGCLDLEAGAAPYSALVDAFRSAEPPPVQLLDALTGAVDVPRSRLFDLLGTTMTALARRDRTVLIIEDVHWSDQITRDALLYLVGSAREGSWALILTVRDDEAGARPGVREFLDVVQRNAVAQVTLDVLSPTGVAAQMAGITNRFVTPDDAARVYERSGGIPLLVEEVVAAEASGISGVPEHLRQLFLTRIAGLGAAARQVVEVVAVVGEPCDERLIAQVLGSGRDVVAWALDEAAGAGVLTTDGVRYRTRHDLLREAVYENVPSAQRRRMHGHIAAALSTGPRPDPALLAHHWYAADEPSESAPANLRAAELADRVHAPAAVWRYLCRALEHDEALQPSVLAAAGGRGGILARAAEAAYLSGGFDQAVALAEESLAEAQDPSQVAQRWERLARYCWVSGDGAGVQHAHEESVRALPDGATPAVRAQVLSGYAWYLGMAAASNAGFDRGHAEHYSTRALEAADAGDDATMRCRALLSWGLARADHEDGLAALWEARELAVRCDAGDELGRAHAALDLALRSRGDTSGQESVLRDGLAAAIRHGLVGTYAAALRYLLAEMLLSTGRWDEAETILNENLAGATIGVPAMFTHAYYARLAAVRGDRSTAASASAEAASLAEDLPQQPAPRAIALCARAEDALWAGEPDAAADLAGQARTLTSDATPIAEAVALHARALADIAENARMTGAPLADTTTVGGDEPPAGAQPRLAAFAATAQAEASRMHGERKPAPWRDAVAAWDRVGDPYHAAYCRWRLARAALATRAGRREAREALGVAFDTATRLGAQPLRNAIESLGTAAKLRLPTSADASTPATVAEELGLTHREREIVPHLVAGRTNAEIAATLVISPRTVGVHVSRILAKLGAARRTEAADIARRRGLVRD